VRLATWNVNSLKARLPRVEEWLGYADADVVCLQETKIADDAFPQLTFEALGYEAAHHGEGRWNGVAILSRIGLSDVTAGFGELDDPYDGDARLLAARCGAAQVASVYVPNGREIGTDHYDRKLVWLERLREWLDGRFSADDPVIVAGDFNVAPDDRDVWDPGSFEGATHVSDPERAAIDALCDWGLQDTFRCLYDDAGLYSYWDYRRGDFHQHRGMRIDLVLATKVAADTASWAIVDRNARKGTKPSDHAPVIVDFDLA